ncbi:unnamed protein product [Gongylonema pulchrum]|uniref:COS domain-containing protein n=1 Tax=Gongylonema pulchrum TaxID=637853 RepID=A0A183D4H6_9BILA|nr:unnamed protein product [Gongylonema pulchrum]
MVSSISIMARSAFIKCAPLKVNCVDFQHRLVTQVDTLIEQLQERKEKLLRYIEEEREYKKRIFKDQIARCTTKLSKTTAMIHFCIEVLKEPNPVTYLQVSSALINRATTQEFLWHKEMQTVPEADPEFVLSLDVSSLQYAIQTLEFAQLKGIYLTVFGLPKSLKVMCRDKAITFLSKKPLTQPGIFSSQKYYQKGQKRFYLYEVFF